MVQSAQDRAADDIPDHTQRREAPEHPCSMTNEYAWLVKRGLRTPTGPFLARLFIGIILGYVAEFAFMAPSTGMVLSSSAARWKSGRVGSRSGA
jgi:hypothetical protein